MLCFYHLDADGKCAGFWIKKLAPKYDITNREKYISIDYSDDFSSYLSDIQKDEIIYIVDFSIPPEDMVELMKITDKITWIDHHKTAIDRYSKYDDEHRTSLLSDIEGLRYLGWSGCMLTYCYFKDMKPKHSKQFNSLATSDAPTFTRLVDDYDMWRFNFEETRAFHEGLELHDNEPCDDIWEMLYGGISYKCLNMIIEEGKTCMRYRSNMMKDIVSSIGFETQLEGYTAFAINHANISSNDFESIDREKYDMLIGFSFDGEKYTYSLRTCKDIDISDVAKKYGGGGHPQACGFSYKDMLLQEIV